eukprot:4282653-Amphidinium_carterae.1
MQKLGHSWQMFWAVAGAASHKCGTLAGEDLRGHFGYEKTSKEEIQWVQKQSVDLDTPTAVLHPLDLQLILGLAFAQSTSVPVFTDLCPLLLHIVECFALFAFVTSGLLEDRCGSSFHDVNKQCTDAKGGVSNTSQCVTAAQTNQTYLLA